MKKLYLHIKSEKANIANQQGRRGSRGIKRQKVKYANHMMMRDGFDVEKSTGVVKSATGFWGLRLFFFGALE